MSNPYDTPAHSTSEWQIAPDATVDAASATSIADGNDAAADRGGRRRFRPAKLAATVLALSLVVFGGAALFSSNNTASALAGHPEKLRNGCTWDSSGNYVQNCKVWSKANNKWITVQIRASNGSDQSIYLLDGMRAREDRSGWTTDVQAAKVYDGSTDTTLVMPVGGASSFYTDWDGGAGDKNVTIKQETFLTSELPDYLASEFGVSKSNNAIVGLSMSGGPAVTLAEKHPDQFKVVQSMSGYYQTDNLLGAAGVFGSQTMVSNYTNGILNMWGLPGSQRWTENDPSKNVDKLKQNGQTLIISSGNGFPSPAELAKMKPEDQFSAIALEVLSAVSTVLMQLQAAQSGANVVVLPNYGVHNWANWGRALRDGKPELLNALRNTPPVTARTQVVSASGSPNPNAAAKVSAAVKLAALESPAASARLAETVAQSAAASASSSESAASESAAGSSQAGSSEASSSQASSSAPSSSSPAESGTRVDAQVPAPNSVAPTSESASEVPDTGVTTSTPEPPSISTYSSASTTTTTAGR